MMSHTPPSLTADEVNLIATLIAGWTVAWFRTAEVWDHNGPGKEEGRYNYVEIDQVAGPSFGGFMVGRNFDGSYGVTYAPNDSGEEVEEWGPFGGVERALQAVSAFTLGEIERWGLRSE